MTTIDLPERLNLDYMIPKLQEFFPDYQVVKTGLGKSILVRKKPFTTRSVTIIPNKKDNKVRIQTPVDNAPMYVFIFWPMAVYILVKRKKHIEKLKEEVINVLTKESAIAEIGKE